MVGLSGLFRGVAVLALFSLAACGGGGGGGGGSGAGSFSIDRNAVAFNGFVQGSTPPSEVIFGTILNVDDDVFLSVVVGGTAVADATVTITSETSGTLTIFPRQPASLGVGTFTDTVVISACLDSACNRQIAGSPQTVAVTYTVTNFTASQPPQPQPPIPTGPTATAFVVNVNVIGLRGQGLILQNNGADDLAIPADGSFIFRTAVAPGAPFNVTVASQPTRVSQKCFVSQGSGTATAVPNATVSCTATKQLGTAGDDEARAATADGSDNLYVTGRTTGDLAAVSSGGWDAFVTKFSPDGELMWQRQLGSGGDEISNVVKLDRNGNVYIAGSTTGDLDGNTNQGSEDIFLTQYDKDGNKQWTKTLGTGDSDVAQSMVFTNDNSIYLVGRTSGVLQGQQSAGGADMFLAKFDTMGNQIFVRQLGSDQLDAAYGVDTDVDSNAYVVGGSFGNFDGKVNRTGRESGFVVMYDAQGTKLTSQLICQTQNCFSLTSPKTRLNALGRDVTGALFVTGSINDNFFYGQVNSDGSLVPALARGSLSGSGNPTVAGNALVLGKNDGFGYIVGTGFRDTASTTTDITVGRVVLGDITGGFTMVPPILRDVGSTANDEGFGVASDRSSNFYAVGRTFGSVDGNPNLGGSDYVVIRFDANGVKQ